MSCTVLTSICFDLQLFPIQAYLPGAVEAARGTRLLESHTPVLFSSPCMRRDGGHERHFEAERHLSSNQQLGTNCFCCYWHRVQPRDAEHFRHVTASSFYQLLLLRLDCLLSQCVYVHRVTIYIDCVCWSQYRAGRLYGPIVTAIIMTMACALWAILWTIPAAMRLHKREATPLPEVERRVWLVHIDI